MAKKPTLTTVTSGYTSAAIINENFQALRDGFDNTVSRDGSAPNFMRADLNLNSNDILNAGVVNAGSLRLNGVDITPTTEFTSDDTDVKYEFESVELLIAHNDPGYFANGDLIIAGGFRYKKVLTDEDFTTAGGDKIKAQRGPYRYIAIKQFGTLGSGNDTEIVRKAHEFANENLFPVSYAGIEEIYIDFDAEIPVATSVDFANVKIKAVGGIKSGTSFDTDDADTMFLIYDADTPIVTGTTTLSAGNAVLNARTPTLDYFEGPGFAFFQGDTGMTDVISSRDPTTTTTYTYRQTFKVMSYGYTNFPLARDISATTSVYYRTRANTGKGWIELRNAVLDLSTFNNQKVFNVQRNEVSIYNVTVAGWDAIPAYTANAIIYANEVSDLVIEDFTGIPADNTPTGSGYMVQLIRASSVHLTRVKGSGVGWGVTGNFLVSGLYVTECELNRMDSHDGMFNIFITNSTFQDIGVIYGWGGGVLEVRDSTFIDCAVISKRVDYDGAWYGGGFTVDGITMVESAYQAVVVDLATNPIGSAAQAIPAPQYINVSNIRRSARSGSVDTIAQITPVQMAVYEDGEDVTCPADITIHNITGQLNWTMYNSIPLLDLQRFTSARRTAINISNCQGRRATGNADEAGFTVPAATKTVAPTNAAEASINADNNTNFSVQAPTANIEVFITGGTVNRVKTESGRLVQIRGAFLNNGAYFSPETSAPIGNGYGTATRYVSLIGCNVHGTFDLSAAQLLSGVAIPKSQSVTLPGGATTTTAVTGWIGGSF